VVVFPTDTVYGIGCDPYCVPAILRIYEVKGRDFRKALPLLLSGVDQISSVASGQPRAARALGAAFWPGALTLVLPRAAKLPAELGGGETIAVRVPDHDSLRMLIARVGGAVAATSANISGQPDALDAAQAAEYFGDSVDLIVDGGRVRGGVPSTVVDCTVEPPVILRRGAHDSEEIFAALGKDEYA
jgi:L-threonylcarbamoyladenylate synthase